MLDQRLIAKHHRATAAQRLAQRGQLQRHVGHAQPGIGHAAAAVLADHAHAVGIVHVQQRFLHARHQRQRAQRGHVAIHAEHAVGDQHRRAVGRVLQLAQRALGIQVRVAAQAAACQPRGIEQAGVVEPVLHAHIVFFAEQRLLHGQVGGKAAAKQQRTRVAEPVGHFPLQRVMQGMVAADQVRGGGAGAFARGGILQRADHPELLRQAQVVIAAEAGEPLAIDLQPHAIATGHRAPHAQAPLRVAELALGLDAVVQVGAGHGRRLAWVGG
ncbi:hypothetical protein D3C71_1398110 [compost metagenome]